MTQMNRLKEPKKKGKKKTKKRLEPTQSIMQDNEDNRCYLCMDLNKDFTFKYTEEHHCIYGMANRAISERLGLKVKLCLEHHRIGKEAVHNNVNNSLILKKAAQRKYEEDHSRAEWMAEMERNWL